MENHGPIFAGGRPNGRKGGEGFVIGTLTSANRQASRAGSGDAHQAGAWAGRLPLALASQLAPLRLHHDLLAGLPVEGPAGGEPMLWIKGPACDEALEKLLQTIGALERFWLDDQHRLILPGERVPRDDLPAVDWRPLVNWLPVRFPACQPPSAPPAKVPLQLVAPDNPLWKHAHVPPGQASLWMGPAREWFDHALSLPNVRLDQWIFALNLSGPSAQVVVRCVSTIRGNNPSETSSIPTAGLPLPSLPGRRLIVEDFVAVPAGWGWWPAVPRQLLQRVFNVNPHDLLLWRPTSEASHSSACPEALHVLASDQWVRCRRPALKASRQRWQQWLHHAGADA